MSINRVVKCLKVDAYEIIVYVFKSKASSEV